MRAEDNTSIGVSWEWSRQGVIMCVDIVTVQYQPEGGSLMMYTVGNTTVTSATLPNLKCNTKYTVWIYVESGSNNTSNMSSPRMVALPARGMYILVMEYLTLAVYQLYLYLHTTPCSSSHSH